MDLSKGIFGTLANSVDPDQTPQNAASLTVQDFVLQTYMKQKQNWHPLNLK